MTEDVLDLARRVVRYPGANVFFSNERRLAEAVLVHAWLLAEARHYAQEQRSVDNLLWFPWEVEADVV